MCIHSQRTNIIFCMVLILATFASFGLSSTIIINSLTSAHSSNNSSQLISLNSSSALDQIVVSQALKQYFGCASLNKGICTQCQDGFYLNQNANCSKISENCEQYNTDKQTCKICYNGYDKIDGNCLIPNTSMLVDHCMIWGQYLCQRCDKSYYLTWRGKCLSVDQNCRVWNQSGYCLKCSRGYYPNGLFSCIQNQTQFKICPQKYFLSQNLACEKIVSNCETWDYYTGRCMSCYAGFDLNQVTQTCSCNNNTQYCQGNCLQFNRMKQCINCKQGYKLNKDGQCESAIVNNQIIPLNCIKFNIILNLCQKCADNYAYSTNDRKCVTQIKNCLTYNNQTCLKCSLNFILVQNNCVQQAQSISESLAFGCAVWDFVNQKCLQCNSKWSKNSSEVCVFTNSSANSTSSGQFCQIHDFSTKLCIDCTVGYMLTSNGGCELSLTHCAQQDSSKKCVLCQEGYSLQQSVCVQVQKCKTIDNVSGECALCDKNYMLSGGKCYTSQQLGNLIFNYADSFPQKLQSLIQIKTN